MEDPGRLQEDHVSRKRHRSEDISTVPFRLTHSTSAKSSRYTASTNRTHPVSEQIQPSNANESQTPLEPLHPPIPNFSAISQPNGRVSNGQHVNRDPPGGVIYNIALPLPNPGRAHRFCQACDHINHVRRKLCTNCGAPKPSAVRNAVGVRSISEVENNPGRPTSHGNFHPDFASNPGIPHGANPGALQSRNRHNGSFRKVDTASQPSEHSLHHARSLIMKCPGDDIPLLGSQGKRVNSFTTEDTLVSRRFRAGQALLCEPLVSFKSFPTQEPRYQAAAMRSYHGSTDPGLHTRTSADHNQSFVRNDQLQLPSMHGMPLQKPVHNDALSNGRNAGNVSQDTRDFDRRYSSINFPKPSIRENQNQGNLYNAMQASQGGQGILYKQPDLFATNGPNRVEEKDFSFSQEGFRRQHITGGFPEHHQDLNRSFASHQQSPIVRSGDSHPQRSEWS